MRGFIAHVDNLDRIWRAADAISLRACVAMGVGAAKNVLASLAARAR